MEVKNCRKRNKENRKQANMNRWFKHGLYTVVALGVALQIGCAPVQRPVVEESLGDVKVDEFSTTLGQMPEGASRMETPIGANSLVTAGRIYQSGLGVPCRQATILSSGGTQHQVAVCQTAAGWFMTPSIFENTMMR